MDKKSFLFYLNWEQQMDIMSEAELRNFIKNLCRYTKGEEVKFYTREERLCWLGILPALENNKIKYEKKVEANRENGKFGGAPKGNQNAKKIEKQPKTTQTTQNNPNNLINDKRKEIIDNREMIIENSKEEKENRKEINETSEKDKEDAGTNNTGPILGLFEENLNYNMRTTGNSENNLVEFKGPNKSIELVINSNSSKTNPIENSEISASSTQNDKKVSAIGEMRDAMNEWFDDYPNWENDLYRLGLDNFIWKTAGKYGTNNVESIDIIKYFLSL